MKKFLTVLIVIFNFNSYSQENFEGIWINSITQEEIIIYKEDNFYYAKSITKENNDLVLNQMVIKNDSKLFGGTYFDKNKNIELEAVVKLIHKNKLIIKLINGIRIINEKIFFERKLTN